MSERIKEMLETQLRREIKALYKNFLCIAEDIQQKHLEVLSEMNGFPQEVKNKWNYLDLPAYAMLRKRILDAGNDTTRNIDAILKDFDIEIKE